MEKISKGVERLEERISQLDELVGEVLATWNVNVSARNFSFVDADAKRQMIRLFAGWDKRLLEIRHDMQSPSLQSLKERMREKYPDAHSDVRIFRNHQELFSEILGKGETVELAWQDADEKMEKGK